MAKLMSRTPTDRIDLGWAAGLFALCFMALALSSCNTVEGMGEDVSAAGGAVSDTADDAEDQM
jgi:predicted small secreted protein